MGAFNTMAGSMPMTGAIGGKKGFTVYHGSPNVFDKFDISKLGEGEGTNDYGKGLYFSENEDVARAYRDALSPPGKLKTKGGIIDGNSITDPSERISCGGSFEG